jgi:hypothetical protein
LRTYATPKALRQAVRAAGVEISDLVRSQFLARVAVADLDGRWLLKGGVGMLARVPDSRSTRDIDFGSARLSSSDEVRGEVERFCAVDLDDFMSFEVARITPMRATRGQPERVGWQCSIQPRFGITLENQFSLDVVNQDNAGLREEFGTSLMIGKHFGLASHPVRLLPIEVQIAEKIFALLPRADGSASSRVRDIYDLAVIAKTQEVSSADLRSAIEVESIRRKTTALELDLQSYSPQAFARIVTATKSNVDVGDLATAIALVNELISRMPQGNGFVWDPTLARWAKAAKSEPE